MSKRFVAGLPLLAATFWVASCQLGAATPSLRSRRVDVHLYGGDVRDGAPLARWYREIGITDVWIYALKGAFPQDQRPETQKTVRQLEAGQTLAAYRQQGLRFWWFERPVPDVLYTRAKSRDSPKSHLWDGSPESDALWSGVCKRIAGIYPGVRAAGFSGLVYDNEAYYSYQGDEKGDRKPWLWGGHGNQYGTEGQYYRRGQQVGRAIHGVWPEAKVIMVYSFGYEGERWWYQGVRDGGVELYLGAEHTYGAGPPGDLGKAWYQSWWQGRKTKETCDWKRTRFPFGADNQHVIAGLFPIDFGKKIPNYRAKHFREQLASAATGDPGGPIAVWIWPQGPFSPQSWQDVRFAAPDTATDYLKALRYFSRTFSDTPRREGRHQRATSLP